MNNPTAIFLISTSSSFIGVACPPLAVTLVVVLLATSCLLSGGGTLFARRWEGRSARVYRRSHGELTDR